jgi:hypothetical protein
VRWLGDSLRVVQELRFVLRPEGALSPAWSTVWEGAGDALGPVVSEGTVLALTASTDRPDLGAPAELERWLAELPALVAGHGGRILEVPEARSTLALFLAEDDRDHAEAALAAALAARELAQKSGLLGPSLDVRLGLGCNTGPLAFRRPGAAAPPEAWTVGGGALGLAEGLSTCLGRGPIAASGATYRLGRHAYRGFGTAPLHEDVGPLPSTIYVIEGRKPLVSWKALLESHRVPLIGREGELRELRSRWGGARSGRGQVVQLIGEPGSGKSKLLETFVADLAGAEPRAPLHRAWGACYGGRPYQLVSDLLAPLCGVSGATRREALADLTRTLEERRLPSTLLDALAAVFELSGERGVGPEDVSAAMTALLRPPPGGSAAVVLDDLHWADAGSLAALERALPAWRGMPLLIVLAYRPSLGDRALRLQAEGDAVVRLAGLDEAGARALAEAHLGALAARWADPILARAGGSPLYIEEAAALVSARADRRGRTSPPGDVDPSPAALPDGIFALLLARVEDFADRELATLEREVGFSPMAAYGTRERLEAAQRRIVDWLDRIEAGDYLGRIEAATLLTRLGQVDLRLRLLHWRLGVGVPLNDRLREALDRLGGVPADEWLISIEGWMRETGDASQALDIAVRAAQHAELRDDLRGAAELFELALRLVARAGASRPGASEAHLAMRLGALREALGEPEAALVAYRRALACAEGSPGSPGGGRQAVRAAASGARAAAWAGRVGEAGELLSLARRLAAPSVAEPEAHPGDARDERELDAELRAAEATIAFARGAGARDRSRAALSAAVAAGRDDLARWTAGLLLLAPGARDDDDLTVLLGHWREGGPNSWSIRAYQALALRERREVGTGRGRGALADRYLAAARALAGRLGCRLAAPPIVS